MKNTKIINLEKAKKDFSTLRRKKNKNYKKCPEFKNYTDTELGKLFANKYCKELKYEHSHKKWYIWNGNYWEKDVKKKITDYVRKFIKELLIEVAKIENSEQRVKNFNFINKYGNARKMNDLLTLASSMVGIRITIDEFDNKPELFSCRNCILDLSGKVPERIDFSQEFLLTQCSKVIYDPNADKPIQFLSFLDKIFNNDKEIIGFIQRLLGYCLTGYSTEDILIFMYGTGKNGKSTFVDILKLIFGTYYMKIGMDSLTIKKSEGINNDIASLKGSRLVISSEIEQGKRLKESLIKDLTGGDDIVARFLYGEYFTFKSTFKLWIYGNHKPIIRGLDMGIRRRIKLIPFEVTIQDTELKTREEIKNIMQKETSGILNWILEGFVDWRKYGLLEPNKVKLATDEYFEEMDCVKNFLNEKCQKGEVEKSLKISLKNLYELYTEFNTKNGDIVLSKREFENYLKQKGFEVMIGTGNIRYWKNLFIRKS